MCGPILGLCGKGFGLRRGGFETVDLGFGMGQVAFAEWCGGWVGSLGCVWVWGVKFRGLGGCLGLGRAGFGLVRKGFGLRCGGFGGVVLGLE